MESIVSTPDPGEHSNPLANGHLPDLLDADLLIEDLAAYEAASALAITPELVAEQTRILEADFEALLANDSDGTALENENAAPLPGFDALTAADLQLCPTWCIHADLPVHSDGFDSDAGTAPHRGVEHTVHAIHGGETIDHTGRAEITAQLEQERDLSTGPTVTISVVVQGIEQYAWLTLPEVRALRSALDHLLTETDTTN